MRSDTICIWDLNLCYRTLGAGPDVLFIHGWASSSRMWGGVMEALADRYRCWAIDLAGFGDSDKPENGWYALPNFTATLRQFAHTVGLRRAHVVGHSMGGMIALDLAAAEPALVERMVVVNPVVSGRVRVPLPPRLDQPVRSPLWTLARHAWPSALAYAVRHPIQASLTARNLLGRHSDMAKTTPDAVMGGLRALVSYDTTPLLPDIAAPTLVMVGDHDPAVAPAEGRLAAERIPNARLEVLPAGHQIVEERPQEFLALLTSFLAVDS